MYLLSHLEFRAEFDHDCCLLIPHEHKTILSLNNKIKTHSMDFIWYIFSFALFDSNIFIYKLNFIALKQRKADYLWSRTIKSCLLCVYTYPQVELDGCRTNGLSWSTGHGLSENLEGAVHTVPTVILSKHIAADSIEEEFLLIKSDVMPFSVYGAGAAAVVLGAFPLAVSAGAAVWMDCVRVCCMLKSKWHVFVHTHTHTQAPGPLV